MSRIVQVRGRLICGVFWGAIVPPEVGFYHVDLAARGYSSAMSISPAEPGGQEYLLDGLVLVRLCL